jgi:hypothetical protein
MSAHEPALGRQVNAQRCRCDEYPQAHHAPASGATWLTCDCGMRSEPAADAGRAIRNWNALVTRGEPC